ncbi:short-chain dehydrogenase [Chitiniphilus shinanonensis]|uniref:Short-chain dehydrogenase n=1 Tax=Chitiniphilus shinanonensis TaxID=553088 RepID=A0ABQ6BWJ0_9NEIS|nr:SDR family oxidoreductase [Chitiniphilus shinanonensis]GLS06355.1 short-chain dehydrogenase [Chitiniphilus shinanonensis]
MFRSDLFEGHVAFVTGGGSGLGRAIAEQLVRHGARVAIAGRREDVLAQTVRELGSEHVLPVRCDIRFADEVEDAVAHALAHFGHIDSLVNSAAGNFVAPTERLSTNAFKLIVDTVLMGTVHCTMTLGKHWIERGQRGSVLSISTNYASTGSAFVVPSGCAKAGVENLIKSLAAEWGRYGLRFVGISPGPFPTEGAMAQLRIHEDLLPGIDIPTLITERIPLGRLGKVQELADLALFLLSPNAEYINGEIIRIDGGETPHLAGEFSFLSDVPAEVWEKKAGGLKRQPARPAEPALSAVGGASV